LIVRRVSPDGHVIDPNGLPWLIGFEDDANPHGQAVAP
jgi:hypothetical protein